MVHLHRIVDPKKRAMLLREIDIIKMLDHPNTIKVVEVFQSINTLYIVMELCTGGELFDRLYDQPGDCFSEPDACRLAKKMVGAIAYLHANGIVHRDLKLENFIFTSGSTDAEIKLLDFGFSRQYLTHSHRMTKLVGTCYYLAPEVLSQEYTEASDLWSLGVVIYMMVTGAVPFGGVTNDAIVQKIIKKTAQPAKLRSTLASTMRNAQCSASCIDFVLGLMTVDMNDRMTASQASQHAWFTAGGSAAGTHHVDLAGEPAAEEDEDERSDLVTSLKEFRTHSRIKQSAR